MVGVVVVAVVVVDENVLQIHGTIVVVVVVVYIAIVVIVIVVVVIVAVAVVVVILIVIVPPQGMCLSPPHTNDIPRRIDGQIAFAIRVKWILGIAVADQSSPTSSSSYLTYKRVVQGVCERGCERVLKGILERKVG